VLLRRYEQATRYESCGGSWRAGEPRGRGSPGELKPLASVDGGLGASDSEVVLIPLGVGLMQWLTPRTVTECTRQLEAQSTLIGMQVYGPSGGGAPRLKVRFRPWWALHQQAELVVNLEPDHSRSTGTAVRVSSGLRVGAAIPLLVWIAAMLVPLLAFSPMPTKVFFAVVLVLPVISALITARLQVRSAMRRLRAVLPPAARSIPRNRRAE
jgi:hypothetical protein